MLLFLKVNTIKGIQERVGEVFRFPHEKNPTKQTPHKNQQDALAVISGCVTAVWVTRGYNT